LHNRILIGRKIRVLDEGCSALFYRLRSAVRRTPADGAPRPPAVHRGDESSWHVSLNNPTDRELRTTCRTGFELPGLKLPRMQVTVPAGGYLVLH